MDQFLATYFPEVVGPDGRSSLRLRIHHAIYFVLLFTLAGCQSVSKFMMSGMEILLAVNWVLEWDMRYKFGRRPKDALADGRWLLTAFLLLLAVHLVAMLWTANSAEGWADIFRKLPLIAIPLVVLTSRPLNQRQLGWVMTCMVGCTLVATIIGEVRLATIDDLPYREIVPFISNIRFSLNICLDIVILLWFVLRRHNQAKPRRQSLLPTVLALLFVVWFVAFLFVLRSYTGLAALAAVALVLLVAFGRRLGRRARILSWSAVAVVAVAFVVMSAVMVRSYYRPVPLMLEPRAELTANGNPYTHSDDGLVENGNLVNNYVCEKELRAEWHKYSSVDIDAATPNGYPVLPTLVRYLNGMGVAKDSVGMLHLTPRDVEAIEHGNANPVDVYGSTLRKMYYVMLFERESYRKLGAVRGFSMGERVELWKNAWRVFLDHPLFGSGTGDAVDECHARLAAAGSQIADTKKHAHNQYLSFLVAFGLVGFAVVAIAFVVALRKELLLRVPVVAAFVTMVLVSCLTEDTLETLAGCVFAVLFVCVVARSAIVSHAPGPIKHIDSLHQE